MAKNLEAYVNLGMFTGKQMKAINAFTRKSKGAKIDPLATPIFYKDYLVATDSYAAVAVAKDVYQVTTIDGNHAYSLPESLLEGITSSNVFYFNQKKDEIVMCRAEKAGMPATESAIVQKDGLKRMGESILNYFNGGEACDKMDMIAGINPEFMKKVCNLADAFNTDCFNFEWVKVENVNLLRVVFPYEPRLHVVIMPMRDNR